MFSPVSDDAGSHGSPTVSPEQQSHCLTVIKGTVDRHNIKRILWGDNPSAIALNR